VRLGRVVPSDAILAVVDRMTYVRIESDESGGSRSVDVDVAVEEQPFAAGVPPLFVSPPFGATAATFVEFPHAVKDTDPHPTPRRQFGVVLSGIAETRTSDGAVRRFEAGSVVLLEDTHGAGHVTTVIDPPFRIVFVALDDDA
jgi:hypothetical protein